MRLIWKMMLLWGMIDSVWLAVRPEDWGRFWLRGVQRISSDALLSRLLACFQFSFCVWLCRQIRCK